MKSYKIHFIRHGSTRAKNESRYIGITDTPLSNSGVKQLKDFGHSPYPYVDEVYTSSLQRCTDTAKILFGNAPINIIPELMEMNFGDFENKTLEEMKDDIAFHNWLRGSTKNAPPNGESTDAYAQRLVLGIDKVLMDMMHKEIFDAAIVMSGSAIMLVMSLLAFPRLPMEEWSCMPGCGFTVLVTPQLWLRDRVFEEFGMVPQNLDDKHDIYWLEKKAFDDALEEKYSSDYDFEELESDLENVKKQCDELEKSAQGESANHADTEYCGGVVEDNKKYAYDGQYYYGGTKKESENYINEDGKFIDLEEAKKNNKKENE